MEKTKLENIRKEYILYQVKSFYSEVPWSN